jgi:hypothetical protein
MQVPLKTIALSVVLVAASVPGAAASGPHCSSKTATGSWGFTSTGSIPVIGPVAAVGIFTADGSGNLSGSQTRSLAGAIADETFTGTYTVNSDCTGTDVIQVYESGVLVRTSTLKVVYDQNGREARAIFQSVVLPNGTSLPAVLTIEAKRITSE